MAIIPGPFVELVADGEIEEIEERYKLHLGDCLEVLRALPASSVDAVVTDPPYDLTANKKGRSGEASVDLDSPYGRARIGTGNGGGGFMGKAWDSTGIAFDPATWREVLRVLKPGGHLLAFGGTRTYHRMTCAIEDAGFEIRDSIHWMYGTGFPKSLNVGKAIDKAIDKAAGAVREVVAYDASRARPNRLYEGGAIGNIGGTGKASDRTDNGATITAPSTPEAPRWEGWGTALKPAHEPVVVARKPLVGTVSANVLAHGTGALNINACRVAYQGSADQASAIPQGRATAKVGALAGGTENDAERSEFVPDNSKGRWPPNVLLSHAEGCRGVGTRRVRTGTAFEPDGKPLERSIYGGTNTLGRETVAAWECVDGCPVKMLDEQSGELTSGTGAVKRATGAGFQGTTYGAESRPAGTPMVEYGDTGTASRFYPQFTTDPFLYTAKASKRDRGAGNTHPTVKPVALMRWLVRLVTPPGGTVLDPFTGSGTTGVACVAEGMHFIGVEREAEYIKIAKARLRAAERAL